MDYFEFPTCFVAKNPRVGSFSISTIAMPTFYPQFCRKCVNPVDFWRVMPVVQNPSGMPIYLLLRDSIDRFLSACNLMQIDIPTALAKLPILMQNDPHFMLQTSWQYTQVFRFDTGIAAFCTATGLPSLPITNETLAAKTTLTADQITALQQAYAADIALYNSLAGS